MDLINGAPVAILTGDEFLPKEGMTFAQQVEAFFTQQGGLANSAFGIVTLDKKGVQNSKQHGMSRIKAASFAVVKDVLEQGEIILPLGQYKKKLLTGMIAAPIQIGDEKYICVVEVIQNLQTRRLYVHESFLTKSLQEIVASNSVHGSTSSSPQSQGEIAKVLQNHITANYSHQENQKTNENNDIKTENYMRNNKRTIRLTESDLHRMIKESVRRMITEHWTDEEGLTPEPEMTEERIINLTLASLSKIEMYTKEGDWQRVHSMILELATNLRSWVKSCPATEYIL